LIVRTNLKTAASPKPASLRTAAAAHAGGELAFVGVFLSDADTDLPSPLLVAPDLPDLRYDDAGGMNLLASLLGGDAMSFVLTDAPGLSMAAAKKPGGALTSPNSALALGANVAASRFGVSGKGVKIGILSDSFNRLGGYGHDFADGDLPGGVQDLEEGAAGGSDEGRAMAELMHQVAPGASFMFHTATRSEADFAAGILALKAAGCTVIVDDVSYLDEPFFQDGGVVQKAVEQVVAQGVSYFTAASNEGTNFYQAAWSPLIGRLPGLPGKFRLENFGTAAAPSAFINLSAPANATFDIDLQWDQPFASISAGGGAANSLAMALYTAGGKLIGTAGALQVGGNAEQLLQFTNHTGATGLKLAVFANGLASPGLLKFIAYDNVSIDNPNAGIGSGTVTGHEQVAGVNTVGAIDYAATPAFGGNGAVESFSSAGSGVTLFDAAGNRLANPVNDNKVSFVAPDGSITSVLAPFYGTSAAAPNAAAVAALMLQADPYLTPGQVSDILARSATPVQALPGAGGAGLINAANAVQMALTLHAHA